MTEPPFVISDLIDLNLVERLLNHIWKTTTIPACLQSGQNTLLSAPSAAEGLPGPARRAFSRAQAPSFHPIHREIQLLGCLNQARLPLIIQNEIIASLVIGEFLFADQVIGGEDVEELARTGEMIHSDVEALLAKTPRIQVQDYINLIGQCRLQLDCITAMANHYLNIQRKIEERSLALKAEMEIEYRFRDIFNGVQDGVLVETLDGTILDANDSACRIYGYTLSELHHLNVKELIPPGMPLLQFNQISDTPAFVETLRLRKDGTTIQVELSGHRWEVNDQRMVIVVVRDISGRKKSEEQIRITQERLELALEATDAGLWDWNILTGSLFISPSWFEMLGFLPNQNPQTHDAWLRLVHSQDISRTNYLIEQHLSGRRPVYEAEYRIRAQEGGWRWVLSRGRVIEYGPDREPRRMIGTYMDISVRKAAEAAWRSSEEKFYKSFQTSPDAISISRKSDAVYLDINDGFCRMSGYAHEEIVGRSSAEINVWYYPDERRRMVADLNMNGEVIGFEATFRRKDGTITIGLISARLLELDDEVCVLTMVRDITERKRSEDLLRNTHLRLEWAYEATLLGWNRALEMRDVATRRHSDRCIDLTVQLAEVAGISGEELTFVKYGAILHDIGKLAIPDTILNKPAKLDRDEWALMRRHPLYAQELLQGIEYLHPTLPLITNHHEHYDGSGYPLGLKGEDIPLAARIFTIVDVWDSIINPRPWRQGLGEAAARQYLQEAAGTHFDPDLVKLFLKIVGE